MDFNRLTIKSQEAVAAAVEDARRRGNPEVYPEHLLLALLDQELPRSLVPSAQALRAEAEARLAQKAVEAQRSSRASRPSSRRRSTAQATRHRSSTTSTSPSSTCCSRSTPPLATSCWRG